MRKYQKHPGSKCNIKVVKRYQTTHEKTQIQKTYFLPKLRVLVYSFFLIQRSVSWTQ